jgi:hypothetical protein
MQRENAEAKAGNGLGNGKGILFSYSGNTFSWDYQYVWHLDNDSLKCTKSLEYGVQQGYQLSQILKVSRGSTGEEGPKALVRYADNLVQEWVPTSVIFQYFPKVTFHDVYSLSKHSILPSGTLHILRAQSKVGPVAGPAVERAQEQYQEISLIFPSVAC